MATIHTHANEAIVNRFASDVTSIGFRILIFVSLEVRDRWRLSATAKIPRCAGAT
jgi:hypothetical protein